ncbi:transcription factor bHLH113-like [Mangifera indica]|uniref:transcription factor bHLH113-like n=1 Tax=Mangifera indica TaxID=29780 RepID=UPI001CFB78A7|nr:transcription factor bHLH113-like [Mangifera indica]
MAGNGGFDWDQGTTTSFSQLLFSDDVVLSPNIDHTLTNYSSSLPSSAHEKSPKMLCFGNHGENYHSEIFVYGGKSIITRTNPPKSGVTCSDSSSASSGNNGSASSTQYSKSNESKKRSGSGKESFQCSSTIVTTPATTQKTSKKTKGENLPKARKEKLGGRITALQQLVSPFGKTDTASVLHEAMGYIRFPHDQLQVNNTLYVHTQGGGENEGDEETRTDLKSRGLCLVPVACIVHVSYSDGADFWSPAMGNNVSSFTKQQ